MFIVTACRKEIVAVRAACRKEAKASFPLRLTGAYRLEGRGFG